MTTKRPPVRLDSYPFHDGSPRARRKAMAEYGHRRPRLRGLAVALAISCAFWLFAVVLPLWLHYGPAGVGR